MCHSVKKQHYNNHSALQAASGAYYVDNVIMIVVPWPRTPKCLCHHLPCNAFGLGACMFQAVARGQCYVYVHRFDFIN